MRSLNKTAEMLQIALGMRGQPVTLDKRTFYSRAYKRVLTKYTVKLRDPESGKIIDRLETYRLSEVVTYLATVYEVVDKL